MHALMCCETGWRDPLARRSLEVSSTSVWSPNAAFGAKSFYCTINGTSSVPNVPLGQPRFNSIGTGDFSVAIFGTFVSAAAISVALSNSGGNNQWRLQPNVLGGSVTAGAFAFMTYDNSLNFLHSDASGLITNNELAMFVGVRQGTTQKLYKNGREVASATGTARNVSGSKTIGPGFGWSTSTAAYASGTQYTSAGHRFYGYIADQAWTPDEVAKLWGEERWAAYFVPHRTYFIPAAAGGASTIAIGAAAFAFTPQPALLKLDRAEALGSGGFAFTGRPILTLLDRTETIGSPSFAFTGAALNTKANRVETIGAPSLALTGAAVTTRTDRRETISAAAFGWLGRALTLVSTGAEVVGAAAFDWLGRALNTKVDRTETIGSAALSTQGEALSTSVDRTETIGAAAFNWLGRAVTRVIDATVAIGPAVFRWRGRALTLIGGGDAPAVIGAAWRRFNRRFKGGRR